MTQHGELPMDNNCLSEETLADFIEGRLDPEQRRNVERHLSACDDCLEMLTLSMGVVRGGDTGRTEPVPEAVTRSALRTALDCQEKNRSAIAAKIRRLKHRAISRVADVVSPLFFGAPVPAPIRGTRQQITKDLVRLQKTFLEIDTEIEIEKTTEDRAHVRVRLAGDFLQEKGVRVALERDDREVFSQLLGARFTLFENVSFGRYRMRFTQNGKNLGEYSFELKESVNGG